MITKHYKNTTSKTEYKNIATKYDWGMIYRQENNFF